MNRLGMDSNTFAVRAGESDGNVCAAFSGRAPSRKAGSARRIREGLLLTSALVPVLALSLAVATPAFAGGGSGASGGGGGVDSAISVGGAGGDGTSSYLSQASGGGGGAGASGGQGGGIMFLPDGTYVAGGAGGLTPGANGTSGSVVSGMGTGGGGGAHGYVGATLPVGSAVTGGTGGSGGGGGGGVGGGGGGGGWGAVITGTGVLDWSSATVVITGGAGGNGGAGDDSGTTGNGGSGGHGLYFTNDVTLTTGAGITIIAGAGGSGASSGAGGTGLVFASAGANTATIGGSVLGGAGGTFRDSASGAGGHGISGHTLALTLDGTATGGEGGNTSYYGAGGAGGAGIYVDTSLNATINAAVLGGRGGSTNSAGGAGGAGIWAPGELIATINATVTGGAGGGSSSAGGVGGAGILSGDANLTVNAAVTGGAGADDFGPGSGSGGDGIASVSLIAEVNAYVSGGDGGVSSAAGASSSGGRGIFAVQTLDLTVNSGTVKGGNAGASGFSAGSGAGGVAIYGGVSGSTVVLGAGSAVIGGDNGNGSQASAIEFTGGDNTLTLLGNGNNVGQTYASITGQVVGATAAGATNKLVLGGLGGVFDGGNITPAGSPNFVNFESFEVDTTGTWIIEGAAALTAATPVSLNVASGTLQFGGTSSFGAVIANTTVADGGTVSYGFAGGTIYGTLTVQSGGALHGVSVPAQTLFNVAGNTTLESGSILNFELGAPTNTAVISISGNLSAAGTLNITDLGSMAVGEYSLLTYGGTLSGSGLTIGTAPSDFSYTIDTTTHANAVYLVVTAGGLYWNGSTISGSGPLVGGDGTWTASDSVVNWSNSDGTTHVASDSSKVATFAATAGTVTVNSGAGAVGAKGLKFTTTNYVIAGDTLTLADASGTPQINVDGASTRATISAPLAGTGGIEKIGEGTLILSGANTYTGTTTITEGTLQLSGAGTLPGDTVNDGTLTFNRAVSTSDSYGGSISGTGAVKKTGAGAQVLSGTNTYTGATTISAGSLTASGGAAIGDSSAVTVASGATLTVSTGVNVTEIIGSLAGAGSLVLDLANTVLEMGGDNSSTLFSGNITGTGGLKKEGTGTLTLSGTNTFSSGTSVSDGLLSLSGGSALPDDQTVVVGGTLVLIDANETVGGIYDGSGAQVIDLNSYTLTIGGGNTGGNFDGTINGTGGLTKIGSGTQTLAGIGNFTGPLQVQAGTLVLRSGTAVDDSSAVTVSSGATLTLRDNGEIIGSLEGGGTVMARGTVYLNTGGNNASTTFTGDFATYDGSSTLGLTKSGAGTFILTGDATYTGITNVMSGTLQIGTGGETGSLASGSVMNFGSLVFNRSGTLTYSGSISGMGTLTKQGSGTLILTGVNTPSSTTISGGILQIGDGGTAGILMGGVVNNAALVFNRSDDLTFGGAISGTGTVEKQGAGTLTLVGASTYSGTTTVSAGTLALSGGSAVGDLSAVTVASGATLTVMTSETAGSIEGAGTVDIGSGVVFTAGGLNTSTTVSGAITGGGDLTKVGTGTLTLSGTNTVARLRVNAGGVDLSGGAAVADSGYVFVNGGSTLTLVDANETIGGLNDGASGVGTVNLNSYTLTIGNGGALSAFSGSIIGTGGLTKIGGGEATLLGVNTFTGPVSVEAGMLAVGGSAIADSVAVSVASGATFLLRGSETIGSLAGAGTVGAFTGAQTLTTGGNNASTTFSGNLTNLFGTLALTKAGTGTLTLTGSSDYTGGTTISGGVLAIGDGGAGGSIAGDIINNAALVFNRSDDLTFSGAISATGTLEKKGAGTLTLTGTNTYSGATTVSGGTLALSGGSAVGDLSAVTVASGATLTVNASETAGSLEGAGAVNVTNGYFSVGGLNTSTTVSGAVTGAGGLQKVGTGTLTLSGTNTVALLTVGGGTVSLSGGAAMSDQGRVYIDPGATLTLADADEAIGGLSGGISGGGTVDLNSYTLTVGGGNIGSIFDGVIEGTGGLTKIGTDGISLSGINTFTGPLDVQAGTLTVSGGAAIADSVAVTIASGAGFSLYAGETIGSLAGGGSVRAEGNYTLTTGGNNASTTFSGELSNSGPFALALVKEGTGVFTLTGDDTHYSGGTTISGGTLQIGAGGTSGLIAGNVVNNAALVFDRSDNISFGGTISGTGTLEKNGNGTLTLTGANSYTGATTVSAGILEVTNGTALGATSAGTTVASGTTLMLNNTGGAGYTLNVAAEPLTLSGTGADGIGALRAEATASGTVINYGGPITLAADALISNTAETLNIDGPITGSGTTLSVTNTGQMNFTNSLSLGAGGLTINDDGVSAGTVSLAAASNYSGETLVAAGVLIISDGEALGSIAGGTTVASGASLLLGGAGISVGAEALSLSGSGVAGTYGALGNLSGDNSYAGAITLADDASIALFGGSLTLSGGISGADKDLALNAYGFAAGTISGAIATGTGSVTVSGGTWTFTGENVYTGGTTISSGSLSIGAGGTGGSVVGDIVDDGALSFNRSDDVGFAGAISGSGTLSKLGAGKLSLTGAVTLTGLTSVSGGTLSVGDGGVLGSLSGDVDTGEALATGTLAFDRSDAVVYGGRVTGGGVLDKRGTGTLTLTSGSTNVASVLVSAGTLALADQAELNSDVTVKGGATLKGVTDGLGTVSSQADVIVESGGRLLAAATGGGGYGLSMATLAMQSGAIMAVELGADHDNAAYFTSNPELNGTLDVIDAGLSTGTYDIVEYAGTATGAGLVLGDMPARSLYALSTVSSGPYSILQLSIAAGQWWNGSTTSATGSVAGGDGVWEVSPQTNWTNEAGDRASAWGQGSLAIFAGQAGTVTVSGGTAPQVAAMEFLTDGYTVSGGAIALSGFNGSPTTDITVGDGTAGSAGWTATIGASLTGGQTLVKKGAGTLVLTGTSSYSGGTTIQAGTLQIGDGGTSGALIGDIANDGTLAVDRSDTIAYGGFISGTGSLVKKGSGTLVLGGMTSPGSYTGETQVREGTLALADNGMLVNVLTSAVTVSSGATLSVLGTSVIDGLAGSGAVTLADGQVLTAGGNDAGTVFSGAITGDGGLRKAGAGDLRLSGTNTFSGGLDIDDGRVLLSGGAGVGDGSVVYLAGDTSLVLEDANETVAALSDRGLSLSLMRIATSTVDLGSHTLTLSGAGGQYDYSGGITGTGGVTKTGAGTQLLSGTNTFTGPLAVNGGLLAVSGGSAVADGVAVTVAAGATFGIVDSTEAIGSLSGGGSVLGGNPAGGVAGTSVLKTGGNNASTTFSGGLGETNGTLALEKQGSGTLTLSGDATYTGGTTVSGGTLAIGNGGASGSIAGDIVDNAAVVFNRSGLFSYAGDISGSGTVEKRGAGTVLLSGASSYTGATTVAAGTLELTGGSAAGDLSAVSVAGGASLVVHGAETLGSIAGSGSLVLNTLVASPGLVAVGGNNATTTFSGAISGDNGLEKQGSGTLTLSGVNDLAGLLASAGTVRLSGGRALADTAQLAIDAGASVVLADAGESLGALSDGLSGGGALALNGYTLTVGGGNLNGRFSGAITGTGGVTKTGTGTQGLSGTNTFTGPLAVNGGTLAVSGGSAVADSVAVTVARGAVFGLAGASQAIGSLAGAGTVAANGAYTLTTGGNNASTTFSGVLSGETGALALEKRGSGTFTLTGANTYTGGTTVAGGTLAIGNGGASGSITGDIVDNAAVVFNRSGLFSYAGDISGSGTVEKRGAGTVLLSGASSYTGATTVAAGTLELTGGSAAGDLSAVSVAGGASLVVHGAETLGSIAGSGSLVLNTLVASPGLVAVGGNNATTTFSGAISGDNGLEKQGSGTLTLSGVNDLAGLLASAGTVRLSGGRALADTAQLAIDAGASVVLADAGESLGALGDGLSGGGTLALNGYTLTVGGGNLNGRFSGAITGTGGVTKTGTGTQGLSGTNTFTGPLAVNGGTLAVSGGSAVADSVAVTVARGAVFGLAGASQAIGSLAGAGTVAANGAYTLTTGGNNASTTFSGVLSGETGALALEKRGSGTFTLTGANTYTGGTTVAGGTLAIGNGGASGSITGDIVDNAAVVFNRSGTLVYGDAISGSGTVEKRGSGTLVLTGTNTYSGGTTVSGGTLAIGDGGTGGSLRGAIASSGRVVFDRSDAVTAPGAITGSGSLVQQGSGTLTLTGANSAAGGTTVAAGTLQILSGVSLASNVTVRAGAVLKGEMGGATGAAIAGAVSVEDGGTLLAAPSTTAGLYGLSMTALTLADSANIDVTLGSNTGNAVLSAGTLSLDGILNVTDGGALSLGVYRIIDYTTLAADNGLQLGTVPLSHAYQIQQAPGQVNLEVLDGSILYWNGSTTTPDGTITGGSGTWTASPASTNWLTSPLNQSRAWNGGFAVFAGQPGTVTVDDGEGPVSATGLQFMVDGYTVSGGTLTLAATSGRTQVRVGDGTPSGAAYVATIGAAIGGSSGLEKTDLGTLILTGTNTYSGGTAVTAGTLQLGNGGTSGSIAGAVALAAGTTLAGNRSDTATLAGRISGAGRLVQQGPGTLVLTGANTYSGGTTIAGGTLSIGDGGTRGAIAGDVLNDGTLAFDRADDIAFGGVISGSGALDKRGAGTLLLSGANSYSGATTVSGGRLALSGGASLSDTARLSVGGGAVLELTDADEAVGSLAGGGSVVLNSYCLTTGGDGSSSAFSGALSGAGCLRKTGTGTLTLSGTSDYAGGTTVSAGTVRVATAGALGTGPLALEGAGTLRASGTFTYDRAVSLTPAGGAGGGTFNVDDAQTLTIASVISGAGALAKTGTGTLVLAGANSFSGATTVSGGRLVLSGGSALADGARLTLGAGTDVTLSDAGETVGSLAGQGTVNLNGYCLTAGGDGSSSAFSGTLSGAGCLRKSGDGTLTLSGTSDYAGGTTVSAGTVQVATAGALGTGPLALEGAGTLRASGTFTYDRAVSLTPAGGAGGGTFEVDDAQTLTIASVISGAGALAKTGPGTLVLSGVNTYSGATNVDAGTLVAAGGQALGDDSAVSVATDARLILQGSEVVGSLAGSGQVSLEGGQLTLGGNDASTTFSGTLSGSGGLTKTGSGVLTLTGAGSYGGDTLVEGGGLTVDGSLGGGDVYVYDQATLSGGGTIAQTVHVLSGGTLAGTQTSGLTMGALDLQQGAAVDVTLGGTGGGGVFGITGDVTLAGEVNVTAAPGFGLGIYRIMSYGGTLTDNGIAVGTMPDGLAGGLQTAIAGQVNLFVEDPNSPVMFWNGSHTSPTQTVLGGSGTWTAAPQTNWTNAYGTVSKAWSGGFAVFQGTPGTVTVDDGDGAVTAIGMQFVESGYVVTGDAIGLTGDALIRVGDGTAAGATTVATIASVITGSAGLEKSDFGTLILTGANTYTGGTTISGGTLQIGDGGTAGSVAGAIADNGALVFNRSDSVTFSGTVSGTGTLAQAGTGTLVLTGANSYAGGTTVAAGTLGVGNDTALGSGGVALADGTTLAFAADGLSLANGVTLAGTGTVNVGAGQTGTLSGVVSGSGALTASGGGTLVLTAANTYAGGTTVAAGTLGVGNDAALGSGGVALAGGTTLAFAADGLSLANGVTLEGTGTVNVGAGQTGTLSGVVSGSGALTASGGGTLVLTAANTYAGGTTVAAGTLGVGNNAALGSGDVALAGGTTLAFAADGLSLANGVTLAGNGSVNVAGSQTGTLSGVVSGSGALTKTGTGTLVLTAANTYSGGTTVAEGTLAGTAASLSGNILNNAAVVFAQQATGTYAGVISGSGSLTKSGTGTLVLTGDNTYTGGTTIAEGTLQIGDGGTSGSVSGDIVNNAALVFNRSGTYTFPGNIYGSGSVAIIGGFVNFTGAAGFSGPIDIADAEFVLDPGAVSASPFIIGAGGLIGGSGTIGGLTVQAGGTAAPGYSPGTLTVAGNVAFSAGSTYVADITAAGDHDLIAASGTATLSGGTVQVVATEGTYAPGTTYTILTAQGGVSGQFASVTANYAFLDPQLAYSANAVTLSVVRNTVSFVALAETANQRAVAGAAESLGAGNAVYDAVLGLSAAAVPGAFNALSGEAYASVPAVLTQESSYLREAVGARLREGLGRDAGDTPAKAGQDSAALAPGLDATFWSQGYGAWGQSPGNANAASLSRTVGGFFAGFDVALGETWRAGAVTGYSRSTFKVDARSSSGDSDNYDLGLYAGGRMGALGLQAGAAYTWHDVSLNRSVAFSGYSGFNQADYDAGTAQVFGEASWRFDFEQRFADKAKDDNVFARALAGASVEPFAGLAYVNLASDNFTEAGSTAALNGSADDVNLLYTTLGVRAATTVRLDNGASFTPHMSLGWQHAFGDVSPAASMAFNAGGTGFQVTGVPIAQNTALIGAGFDYNFTDRISASVSYGGQFSAAATDNTFKGTINVRF